MTYCNLFHLDLDILSRGHEANLEAGKWGEKQITHGTFHILFGLQQMAYIHSEAVSKPELFIMGTKVYSGAWKGM